MDYVQVIGHGPKDRLNDACRIIGKVAGESDYLWHYEPFEVLVEDIRLVSLQVIGDSLADEWAVLHIILKASRRLPEFYFTIEDQDGQFVLFEAAYELGDDLEGCELAVYIWKGKIYLPPSNTQITLPMLGNCEIKYKCIEGSIDQAMKQTFHHARLVLPKKSMAFLQSHPKYIGLAIHSFCYRTPDETKKAAVLALEPNAQVINGILRFSRLQYAQLMFQPFKVPESLVLDNLGHRIYVGLRILLSTDPKIRSLYTQFDETTFKPAYHKEDSADWLNETDSDMDFTGFQSDMDNFLADRMAFGPADVEFDDDFGSCSSGKSDSESSYDTENEVIEALKGDPELFMKALQLHSEAGISVEELITRVKNVNLRDPLGKQKGLSDISSKNSKEFGTGSSDDDKDIDLMYNETMDAVKKRLAEGGLVANFSDNELESDYDDVSEAEGV